MMTADASWSSFIRSDAAVSGTMMLRRARALSYSGFSKDWLLLEEMPVSLGTLNWSKHGGFSIDLRMDSSLGRGCRLSLTEGEKT